jgi:hypothetical protein
VNVWRLLECVFVRRAFAFVFSLPSAGELTLVRCAAGSWRIRQAPQWCPVRYVVFDLLYHTGRWLVREPLARRREPNAKGF